MSEVSSGVVTPIKIGVKASDLGDSESRLAEAVRVLARSLGKERVVTHGPAYEKSREIWNAAVNRRPGCIVLSASASDVQRAVLVAAAHGLPVSARGGGHDWAGRSLRGDIVVDLTRLSDVQIEGLTADVGGGATAMQVAEAVEPYGLSAVTGIIGSVGIAGLLLGGGYGHFTSKYGLALDKLLGAEIVLADGRLVQTDATTEPDLFWALRGGGGNFGIVTKLKLQLQPIADLSDGTVSFPWDQTQAVLQHYNAKLTSFRDELTVMPTFFAAPDGTLSLVLHHAFCGDKSEDEEALGETESLGVPALVQVKRKTLAQVLKEAEKRTMVGVCWIVRTVTLAEFAPEAIDIIKRAMEHRSSPLSWIAAHPFYGAGTRIPAQQTAFGIRSRHIMVGIYTAWRSGEERQHRSWADAVEAELQPFALPSSYPNYFGTDRPAQALQAYGLNAGRLLQLKEQYDPSRRFEAISLPYQICEGFESS